MIEKIFVGADPWAALQFSMFEAPAGRTKQCSPGRASSANDTSHVLCSGESLWPRYAPAYLL